MYSRGSPFLDNYKNYYARIGTISVPNRAKFYYNVLVEAQGSELNWQETKIHYTCICYCTSIVQDQHIVNTALLNPMHIRNVEG